MKLKPTFDDSIFETDNGLDRPETFSSHIKKLVQQSEPIPHAEILAQLIEMINPVDFRELAELSENKNPRNSHFQIITVEQVLNLAKQNKWGICQNHDFIYLFNGAYWSLLDQEELRDFLGQAAERMGVDKFKARYFQFRDHLYKQFLTLANLPAPDRPKDLVMINLKNGTFEITPGDRKLRPFNRQDFITYQLPFEYNPKADAPIFKGYLNRVLPDQQRQMVLAEFLGYVFIKPNTLKLEKTLLLHGYGANGKSVFYDIVRNLLGEQNTCEYSLQSLTNENGYFRAMIANKLVNYASEINGRLQASIFKLLVSGEPVEARLPYGRPFILTEYAKLIFNCNELPKEVEQTEAYFRRFLIVQFEVTIPEEEQDKQLAQKIIKKELPGVFNWVLEGLDRLLSQQNFTECEAVWRAREEYKIQSDSVKLFMDEASYEAAPNNYKLIKELYPDYRSFCTDYGHKPVNKTNFTKRLDRAGIVIERKKVGMVAFLSKGMEM